MQKDKMKKDKKGPDSFLERIIDILMKRYAVEKIIGWKKLLCVIVCSIISFFTFQVTWILCSYASNLYVKFLILMGAVIFLSLCWRFAWKSIGRIIPKFVLIGMLGWIFIIVNITPNLIIGDKWGLKENVSPYAGEDRQDKAPGQHSTSWPISRLLNLNEKETGITGKKPNICEYLESFLFPIRILRGKQVHPSKQQILNVANRSEYNVYIYFQIGICLIVGILLFLNISTYRKNRSTAENSCSFYLIDHRQREENTKTYLILLCVSLIGIAYLSLNYFLFFWVVTFIATVFLFRWEIEERGKNHKKLSRSVLFVILAQVFSSITGEILFLILLPLYTDIGKDHKLFNLYDSVVLGWLIFLGSAVTVLIGIVTQVIWSGKRMTDRLRS